MKQCTNEKCNTEIDDSKKFCSRSCAASHNNKKRKHSEETKQKIRNSIKNYNEKYQLSEIEKEQRRKSALHASIKWQEKCKRELLEAEFSELKFERKRKRIIIEQDGKCSKCDIDKWMGQPITLEVDHINGDAKDDRRENLEALCPNCHSITPTWRGRNKAPSKRKPKISDDQIVEKYLEHGNIRKCLLMLGLAAKGSNYGRVKRVLTMRGIQY